MKLALISGGLFLVSYVAVNRGFGPHPLVMIVPLAMAIGTSIGTRWLMRRGRHGSAGGKVEASLDVTVDMSRSLPGRPAAPLPPSSPRSSGGKARKLF